jgi:hypothetical protein
MAPTTVDADVANAQRKYEGMPFAITIAEMKPERLFSFRWHPGAVDPQVDYSVEPMTLMVLRCAGSMTRARGPEAHIYSKIRNGREQVPG